MDFGLVCDSCSALSAMSASACTQCGKPISLEPTRAKSGNDTVQVCPSCSARIALGHRFCFNCGDRMPEFGDTEETQSRMMPMTALANSGRSTLFFGAMQGARAKLTMIRSDGLDGVSFTLAGDEHLAGRVGCPLLFPDDALLSPVHANFFYRDGQLVVRDESNLNGVYVRIHGTLDVPYGTRFLAGEQLLEVLPAGLVSDDAEPDGTYFYGTPRRPTFFRLVQLLRGNERGRCVEAHGDSLVVGREGNDLDFPIDPFISGRHSQVRWASGRLTLTDLNSRNGTFVRIVGEHVLKHGDYVFMGQQLLRVEIV
jgi:hypothetical protein